MDTFAGLPAHPLLVHAPVVLVPVVALLVILMIVRPQWLERFGWLAVGLAGLALVTGVLAENSGEALEEAVEDSASRTLLHAHEEAGEKVPLLAFLLFASLVAWVGWQWWSRRSCRGRGVGVRLGRVVQRPVADLDESRRDRARGVARGDVVRVRRRSHWGQDRVGRREGHEQRGRGRRGALGTRAPSTTANWADSPTPGVGESAQFAWVRGFVGSWVRRGYLPTRPTSWRAITLRHRSRRRPRRSTARGRRRSSG
jgi:uncharacterized membrane protein